MNRREFIKKAIGYALSLAVPISMLPKKNAYITIKEADEYFLGKGTLYVNGIEMKFLDFTIKLSDLESINVPKAHISPAVNPMGTFSLDEINVDNIIKILGEPITRDF